MTFLFYVLSILCFFIPKTTRKIPLKNLGLLNNTTFINTLHQHFALENPSIITQIASTPIKSLGGQKQLIKSPPANAIAIKPLLKPWCLRIMFPPYNTII
jgi:hypothetical protein